MNNKQIINLAKRLQTFSIDEINMIAECDTSGILKELIQEKTLIKTGETYQFQVIKAENIIKLVEPSNYKSYTIKKINFVDAVEYFLKEYASKNCTVSTFQTYRSICRCHLLPFFSKKLVSEITKQDLEDFINLKHRQNMSAKRLNNCITLLGNILSKFEEWNFLKKSPYKGIMNVTFEKCTEINVLSKNQQDKLLKTTQKSYAKLYPIIFLLLHLGIRKTETLALSEEDFDFENLTININKKRYEGEIFYLKKPRIIDIPEDIVNEIKAFDNKKTFWFYNEKVGFSSNDKFFRREFRKLLEELGFEKMFIDELRHTYAFNVLQAGGSIDYLHRQLGDYSIQATMDKYGKFIRRGL